MVELHLVELRALSTATRRAGSKLVLEPDDIERVAIAVGASRHVAPFIFPVLMGDFTGCERNQENQRDGADPSRRAARFGQVALNIF